MCGAGLRGGGGRSSPTLGFIPVRRDEIDSEVPKGKVVGTDPPVGTPVLPGDDRINVRVSLGLPGCHTPRPDPSASTARPGDAAHSAAG